MTTRRIDPHTTVAVIGLGYVGLPLAVEFGKHVRTIGFDLSQQKIAAYLRHEDPAGEVSSEALRAAIHLLPTCDPSQLSAADFLIIAVPTPVTQAHQPDFTPLISASEFVGKHMKRGATVVYESTVYPGATEEICIPVLEKHSDLKWQTDFFVGYSPERINPGDREHTLTNVIKVVSGDSAPTLDKVAALYAGIVGPGVYRASGIRVAEAAKVIENTQRDLNIAFMNELAIICDRLGIDTTEVLEAAGTKWNFLPFRPGLVGGHCIGVDPYYLTHKAEMLGYHPQVILAGRRINDSMGEFVAQKTVKLMVRAGFDLRSARVNVLGVTFKENCSDVRNSKVPDIVRELASYGVTVATCDPLADGAEMRHEYGIDLVAEADLEPADAVIIAVGHKRYAAMSGTALARYARPGAVVIDVKSILDKEALAAAGFGVWRL